MGRLTPTQNKDKILTLESSLELFTAMYTAILSLMKIHKDVGLESEGAMINLLDILSEMSTDSLMYIKVLEGSTVDFTYYYDTPQLIGENN